MHCTKEALTIVPHGQFIKCLNDIISDKDTTIQQQLQGINKSIIVSLPGLHSNLIMVRWFNVLLYLFLLNTVYNTAAFMVGKMLKAIKGPVH